MNNQYWMGRKEELWLNLRFGSATMSDHNNLSFHLNLSFKLAKTCNTMLPITKKQKRGILWKPLGPSPKYLTRVTFPVQAREMRDARENGFWKETANERELADTATLVKCISWWYDSVRFRIPHAKPGESPHRIIDEFFCDQSVKSISKTGKCAVTNFRLPRNWYPFEIFNSSAEISREENK